MLLLLIPFYANAGWWDDLWQTKDQQGKVFLSKGQPQKAAQTFKRKDWQSVAHYRAGQYKQAATTLSSTPPSLTRYYNQGNALAHLGQYEKAIQAYNQALKVTPKDPDTLYNKKIVESLLKQQKQEQQKNQENQQNNMNNQPQPQQQSGQDKQKQPQNQSPQNTPSQPEPKSGQNKGDQQDTQQQNNNNADQGTPDKPNKQPASQQSQPGKRQAQAPKLSANAKEQQQAQMQRLKRIPDDPGGLLRQKFIRDYIKRHPERW